MSHLPTLGSCSDLAPFPVSVHTHLGLGPRSQVSGFSRGFLSQDDHLAFLYRGPNLEVLNARTNERLAAWTFENIKVSHFRPSILPFIQNLTLRRAKGIGRDHLYFDVALPSLIRRLRKAVPIRP